MPFSVCGDTKLQSFQYRVIHRILPCNKWLFNISVSESSKCNFCEEEDDILHFLVLCKNTYAFWTSFYNWWYCISNISIQETIEEHLLFGYPGNSDTEITLNFCVLLGKYYIYCKKLQGDNNIDLYEYLVKLKQRLSFEKQICQNKMLNFEKWACIYDQL